MNCTTIPLILSNDWDNLIELNKILIRDCEEVEMAQGIKTGDWVLGILNYIQETASRLLSWNLTLVTMGCLKSWV